jgi:purine-binding chemotaxis protein CheW
MDIAKIRKKIRESGAGGEEGKDISRSLEKPEDKGTPSDEKFPGQSVSDEVPAKPAEAADKKAESRQELEPAIQEDRKAKGERPEPSGIRQKAGTDKAEEVVEILTFSLLKEDFAFSISHLEEILKYQRITAVPNVPKYILGITSLRGKVIPVIDLKLKLSLTGTASDDTVKGKILIVRGPRGPIGVAVDKVIGVVRIPSSEILPPPSHLSEGEVKFIDGIAVVDKRFVSIINMPATMTLNLK